MSELLPVITRESVELISTTAPLAYEQGKASHDACIAYGEKMLSRLDSEGMSDNLDSDMAKYVDRAKQTVKKINGLRAPITKLFDEFRNVFTALENEVNPAIKTSVPGRIQIARNQYATIKRAAEEQRRAAEAERIRKENVRKQYMLDATEQAKSNMHTAINTAIALLDGLYNSVTPDNEQDVKKKIMAMESAYKCLAEEITVAVADFTEEEQMEMKREAVERIQEQLKGQYRYEIEEYKADLLHKLPGKVKELQEIARASAEEAERRRQQMAEVEAAENARREEERKRREEEAKAAAEAERMKAEIERMKAEIDSLFADASATANIQTAYAPMTRIKLRMNVLNPEGFPEVLMFWWSREGKNLSTDELSKKFKTIITYCEKVANSEGVKIASEHIEYVEEVKAMWKRLKPCS